MIYGNILKYSKFERGMTINDVSMAHKILPELNYYSLEEYWLPLESDHKCM